MDVLEEFRTRRTFSLVENKWNAKKMKEKTTEKTE